MIIDYQPLVDHLQNGNLAAFLGCGVSTAFSDELTGRTWPGIPCAADMVRALAARRNYIDASMPFTQACHLFKHRESRSDLEEFLLDLCDRPSIDPLPSHVILAALPFSAFLTTNYDILLETALEKARHRPLAIIEDADVSRLRPTHVPVIKIHGSVSRPKTMVAAADEYVPLAERMPVVEALIRAQLANRRVLFLGFSLSDPDFGAVFEQLTRLLPDHMPRSTAVVRSASPFERDYWSRRHVDIVEADLTDFLRGLLRATAEDPSPPDYHPTEEWLDDPFFVSLQQSQALPSETTIIDAFLAHLLEEVRAPGLSLAEAVARGRNAVSRVLARADLAALRNLHDDLLFSRLPQCESKDEAETVLGDVIAARLTLVRRFQAKGPESVSVGQNLLLYASSSRVTQLLEGVPAGIQKSCKLFIAECRPKSLYPFQDAVAICHSLRDTRYDIALLPDAAAGNLMSRGELSAVFMGAHAVYTREESPVAFINTCGSHALAFMAEKYDVPVYVVAERMKITELPGGAKWPAIPSEQVAPRFWGLENPLSELAATGRSIDIVNPGYDVCPFSRHTRLITED